MSNLVSRIKRTVKSHQTEIIAYSAFGICAAVGAAAMYTYMRSDLNKDVIIPENMIEHMKTIDGALIGVGAVRGYDLVMKLIPVQS